MGPGDILRKDLKKQLRWIIVSYILFGNSGDNDDEKASKEKRS